MQGLESFLTGYWLFAHWMLAAMGTISVLTLTVLRRPGKAFGFMALGLYVTLAYYLMATYPAQGLRPEYALALVVAGGLALSAGFYYFFFVRAE